jgi:alpha-ribazole phosphatase
LWAARHAPVDAAGTCYGRSDVPVRLPPEQAASRLVEAWAGPVPRTVWSSPSPRCRDVAARLAPSWAANLVTDARLGELDFGAWEGRTWAAIERDDGAAFARWMGEWRTAPPPGGECPADLEARVRAWARALEPDGPHALVAHAGVVRALSVVLEDASWDEAMARPVEHLVWRRFPLDR